MKKTWMLLFVLSLGACSFPSLKKLPLIGRHLSGDAIQYQKQMDMNRLKAEAFARCQTTFLRPLPVPVVVLDPPRQGGANAEGMVYAEELSVRTTNFLDRDGFYFSPRPRAAVNVLPMDIFVDQGDTGIYERKTWEDANPDYTSGNIIPPIDKKLIPEAGKVLTEIVIGHRSPQGDYPQLFDIRSSAYVRFAGYPPQITGASLRLGAHKIFSLSGNGESTSKEDFPIVRSIYLKVKNPSTANALVLVESDLFCGALSMDMTEANNAELLVDSFWFTRENYRWKKDPHTGFVAYSSMLWKTEKHTPSRSTDEAHDSDALSIKYANGKMEKFLLDPPMKGLQVRDFTSKNLFKSNSAVEWTLANEDLNPEHYADFAPALGATNYNYRASYQVQILESDIKTGVSLYEQAADGEYGDNIVAVSTLRQDIDKAKSVDDAIHFKYKTTAFFPQSEE